MFYVGNNIMTASVDNAVSQMDQKVQKLEDSISIFDDQIKITRMSLHYGKLCNELSLSENPWAINGLTGTVQDGVAYLSNMDVCDKNMEMKQESVKGVVVSFQQAVEAAKINMQKKAEIAKSQQKEKQNQTQNINTAQTFEPQKELQKVDVSYVETQENLDKAVEKVVNNTELKFEQNADVINKADSQIKESTSNIVEESNVNVSNVQDEPSVETVKTDVSIDTKAVDTKSIDTKNLDIKVG